MGGGGENGTFAGLGARHRGRNSSGRDEGIGQGTAVERGGVGTSGRRGRGLGSSNSGRGGRGEGEGQWQAGRGLREG